MQEHHTFKPELKAHVILQILSGEKTRTTHIFAPRVVALVPPGFPFGRPPAAGGYEFLRTPRRSQATKQRRRLHSTASGGQKMCLLVARCF